MGGTKESMISGAPRNMTLAEQQLVRRAGPPPAAEHLPLPEPIPARAIPLAEAPRGARTFAKKAEAAGFTVEAVASRGPLLNAKGTSTREVNVVSVRCSREGCVEIAAAWSDGSYDMAIGRRPDGTKRLATKLADAEGWLDYGIDGDMPETRDVARFLAKTLGATLIGVRHNVPTARHVCPVPLTDAAAADHLRTVHRLEPLDGVERGQHDREHARVERNHTHERWPLGEPARA